MSRHRQRRRSRRNEHRRAIAAKRTALTGAGLSLGVTLVAGTPAQAADFAVTNLNDSGSGSLRQAITDANATAGADRILFQSTLTGQITLGSALPGIQDGVEIVGPGADKLTISGNNSFRIFNVNPTFAMNMSPVTISGLKLTAASVTADSGAAIGSKYTDLTVANVVISQSNADQFGGGIANVGGHVTIRSSTISGNTARSNGGGIFTESGTNSKGLTIENSTITGNSSSQNAGGGIEFRQSAMPGTAALAIRSSTISANSAGSATDGGGGLSLYGGTSRTIVNTIVAGNTAPVNPDVRTGPNTDLNASFSLIETPAGATIVGGPNITGQDPKLAPLADNGGPTPTQALNLGSPAIDQGQATGVDQRGAPRPFDFAGVALAGDNDADIGAYERVTCGNVLVNKIGTEGNDQISGTAGPDGILGLGGNDTLGGLAGNDGLCGGPGNDKLIGGKGNDRLLGQAGKDKLKGGKGKDLLKGGSGNDVLIGGKGKDKLKGGKGKDKLKQ